MMEIINIQRWRRFIGHSGTSMGSFPLYVALALVLISSSFLSTAEGVKVWLTLSPLVRCGSRQITGVEHHPDPTPWSPIASSTTPAPVRANDGQASGLPVGHHGTVKCIQREILINWAEALPREIKYETDPDGVMSGHGDWIGLFDEYPRRLSSAIRRVYLMPNDTTGLNSTGITFPNLNFDDHVYLPLQKDCLGYCVAYVTSAGHTTGSGGRHGEWDETIVATNCLRTQPFWMEENMSAIGGLPLYRLFLPGTHNSGSYRQGDSNPGTGRIAKYLVTQDETIFDQLVYGIRYLDLRIGWESPRTSLIGRRSSRNATLWIVHDIFNSNVTLEEALRDVRKFLDESTGEVVVLDFHRFVAGFKNNKNREELIARHEEWFDLIHAHLGTLMIPTTVGYNYRLRDLVKTNKRVLVAYAHKNDHYVSSDLLWPPVNQLWANKDRLEPLEEYMNETVCHGHYHTLSHELRASMAELTPTTMGTLMDRYGGLRVMANEVARPVTDWFRTRWWSCANIVAVDFFHSTNIIEVAIDANRARASLVRHGTHTGSESASPYPDSSFAHCSNFLYLGRRRVGTRPLPGRSGGLFSSNTILTRTSRRMYDSIRSGLTSLWSKVTGSKLW